jgi:hypothetical protein
MTLMPLLEMNWRFCVYIMPHDRPGAVKISSILPISHSILYVVQYPVLNARRIYASDP